MIFITLGGERLRQTIDTSKYDNVVVIDAQVVLQGVPLEQMPWSEIFDGSILLLVTRQVQTEIDRRKNDGRLGKRARSFNRLLDSFIETRIPATICAEPKVDIATVSNQRPDWDQLDDLDREDPDDRIVAQALNANVDDPDRLVLLSHDMRPRDAAQCHGLTAKKLPEHWLRQIEPSPHERKITELEARNRLLSQDQPQLEVKISCESPAPWECTSVSPANEQEVKRLIQNLVLGAPRQRSRSGFELSGFDYDSSHSGRLKEWENQLRQELPFIHKGLSRLFSQKRIIVSVKNVGSVPAENLSLEIRSGNTVLHSKPFWVMMCGASAPRPQMMPYAHHLHAGIRPEDLISPRREPFDFYWDERGPRGHLILSCNSFRQEKRHEIEISAELLSSTVPKAEFTAVVTASNLKGDARDQLLVEVSLCEKRADEIFDFGEGVLVLRPDFDLPDELSPEKFAWYLNSGDRYDPS
ncbi:hypothetical protein FGU71_01000 [Erythrobacter insulae]|uniref:PIN domain-containing protein n=1 Tax=Erythrobacter insulae TaxID=2584124 RepID=A0A547P8Y4_9SPHN|nr:PIN domain-containing protein [Erythrobacter insulae]TRD10583.1 hypothetical protein FGU71_01000 [Erythrobacter insulae]